jgi:HK97 family phage major capsid protein
MSKIAEIREKQAKLVADARTKFEEIKDDTPEARAKEIEAEYDKVMAEYDRLEERAKKEEALAEREAALDQGDPRRPKGEDRSVKPGDNPNLDEKRTAEENRVAAFRSYLCNGLDGMPPEERKTLREMRAQSTADPQGGYTIPQGFMAELVVALKAYGPMLDPGITRELVTASGNQIDWPTLDDTANQAYRLGENVAAVNEGDLAFGNKQLDAYKYASGPILVSSELLQDSALNVEQIIRDAMAVRFGRKVNADLTIGDGVGDPNGIVTAAPLGVAAAAAAAITFDDLIELQHSIDPAYRSDPSCRWMFHDSTLKRLRKLKDLEGNYIWQPADVRSGAPAVILDHPYTINQAMAQVATLAKSVIFGAMNRYVVRRVREMAIRRLVERYAEFDQVAFLAFARFDGELMDANAVKHLAHP